MSDQQNDIDRYLNGQMGPAEMHALEKKALNDAFLADALEGAGSIDKTEFQTDLDDIALRMTERKKYKIDWKIPLRIAAGLAVAAIVSYGVYRFALPSTTGDELALKKSEQATTEPAKPDADSPAPAGAPSQSDKKSAGPAASSPAPKAIEPAPFSASDVETLDKAASGGAGEQPAEKPLSVQAEKSAAAEEAVLNQAKDDESAARKAPGIADLSSDHQTVTGKVTDAGTGTPLAGVNVVEAGSTNGAVSDSNGEYEVKLNSKTNVLVFSSLGFETKEVHIKATETTLNVQLPTEDSQLNEVVVVGYSKNENETLSDEPIQLAEPADGRRAYNKYLDQNLRYPDEARTNKIEGRVTVEFTVQTDGSVSNFNVVHGLGGGCNEEVIRLVKEGPSWKPSTQGNTPLKSTMRVRVKFKL